MKALRRTSSRSLAARGFVARNPALFTANSRIGHSLSTTTSSVSRTRSLSTASAAFAPSELPAVRDLFSSFAVGGSLDKGGLRAVLESIGERPSDGVLDELFAEADADRSGSIDLHEFMAACDLILGSSPARSILVVGGPGSGKGVLCSRLVAECGVSHVSCGDMLREEVSRDTPLGRQCAEIMCRGELVSSEIVITLLRRRMREFPGRRLLLDGFPRSRENAIDFAERCGTPELALTLTCPESLMVERILRRAELEGRADDNYETARARIATYREQGAPTITWLREQRVPIVELDCSGTPDDVWAQLLAVGRLMRQAVAL